jgi:hydrogenase expression/formation protein HypC
VCLGIPAEVDEVLTEHPDLAKVRIDGVARLVNIGLLEEQIGPGDWMLVHMGFALSKIDEEEAHAAMDFLGGVERDYRDAVEAPGAVGVHDS